MKIIRVKQISVKDYNNLISKGFMVIFV